MSLALHFLVFHVKLEPGAIPDRYHYIGVASTAAAAFHVKHRAAKQSQS